MAVVRNWYLPIGYYGEGKHLFFRMYKSKSTQVNVKRGVITMINERQNKYKEMLQRSEKEESNKICSDID